VFVVWLRAWLIGSDVSTKRDTFIIKVFCRATRWWTSNYKASYPRQTQSWRNAHMWL